MSKYLITSALPYANGPIHFGHIAGAYLPADIFNRFLRQKGENVLYICGTDEHGVAITINAEKEGIPYKQYVDRYHNIIKEFFDKLNIRFDHFSRTTIPEHYALSQEFFLALHKKGLIKPAVEDQFYCSACNRFLADRYVSGACPKCGAPDVRGDECTKCGEWLDPSKIISPACKVCGRKPEIRRATQYFMDLKAFAPRLKEWLENKKDWKPNVKNKALSLIEEGLVERAITRDLAWGVPVPLEEAKGKVLYVWFDAPIGYVSSTMEWARLSGKPEAWKDWWFDKETKLIHFIGKDNIIFHTIIWPAMLMGQDKPYIIPDNVPGNEFYNLEGRQFSKSDGWYIDTADFFSKYGVDALRYAIASNGPETSDSQFAWEDFQARNNELADSLGNLVNRCFSFIRKNFDGKIPAASSELKPEDKALLDSFTPVFEEASKSYYSYRVRAALTQAMALAHAANKYVNDTAPWTLRKTDLARCGTVLNVASRAIINAAIILYPVIPDTALKILTKAGMNTDGKAPEFKPYTGDLNNKTLGTDDTLLFTKIPDDQIKLEIEKLKKTG
ncbi:MAG: methionine--tRNA ligase [Elusimicrobia bacterium GWA2_56_46]|nr:MAG: methionine--tRNA ligase [Elusimicrobia bacterium GWA2_56_46]OGR55370.1 MAG: methionine--tRNA ligase [Elusimicrobia bacterium GWC2_56_31]HBB68164.1 methionine--tRNA ligase [Elusimicrobiota bacterium]HBW21829.1 methionine--tRNA ligase [Elusimicrobiota bacterium]